IAKPIEPSVLIGTLERWMKPRKRNHEVTENTKAQQNALKTDVLPISLQPFDLERALVRVNGKKELLRRLIISFHDDFESVVAQLREEIIKGDLISARRTAHNLKSVAASL